MERKIKRGDIYYANLNPVIGSEQGGTRPVPVSYTHLVKLPIDIRRVTTPIPAMAESP